MSKKTNLLIITLHADPSMPPGVGEWGGTHTYMRELLTELNNKNFNIILVTRKVFREENDIEIISNSCKIIRLTLGEFGQFDKRKLYDLHERTFQLINSALSSENFTPDVIHSVYWNSGHIAMSLSKLWNIPYVHSVISNGIGRNFHGATGTAEHRIETEQKVFDNASYILCVAESEKEEIHRFYNIPKHKILVAGQYVHPSFVYPPHDSYGLPRKSGINYRIENEYYSDSIKETGIISHWWNQKAFTYTGRMSLDKGIHYIVQAWYILYNKYKNCCPPLWLIGGDTYDIETLRSKLGIDINTLHQLEAERKIVWWGYLDENGISALYTRSLVLLTHSLYEPGGRVAVEAMCSGIPVIATPNGFALDSITNWYNGFLVNHSDIESLSFRMEHFIRQPYLSNIMGRNAISVGRDILKNWSFKDTHISAYLSAKDKTEFAKKICGLKEPDNSTFQYLQTYPYNQILVDENDILDIAISMNLKDISDISKISMKNSSSMFWSITSGTEKFVLKIPYDRMTKEPLWQKEKPGTTRLVNLSRSRFNAEIGASALTSVAPIIGKYEPRCAIVRNYYENREIDFYDKITNTISALKCFYTNDVSNFVELFDNIEALIEKGTSFEIIDAYYKEKSLSLNPWQNYFRDYSLRVEFDRWKNYYEELPNGIKQGIVGLVANALEFLSIIILHVTERPKLATIHGGCDIKNLIFTPQAILLDNEKVHVGWLGMDFSDLLITINRPNHDESIDMWKKLLSKIPQSIIKRDILIGWIVLGIIKETVSMSAMFNSIDCQALSNRLESLKKIYNEVIL